MECKWADVALLDGAKLGHAASGAARPLARQELIEDDADCKEIGADVKRLSSNLLGSHISQLTFDHCGARPARAIEGERDTKVGEFDLPFIGNEDIVRRDVPVNESRQASLHGRQAPQNATHDKDRDSVRHQPRPRGTRETSECPAERREVEAQHELQHKKRRTVVLLPYPQERDDVRVAHLREQPRLFTKGPSMLLGELRRQTLDADLAWKIPDVLARPVDGPRCPAPDALEQFVLPAGEGPRQRRQSEAAGGFHPLSSARRGRKLRKIGRLPRPGRRLRWGRAPHYVPRRSDPTMPAEPRETIQPTTRDVSARGARVRFVEAGSGPPLLLIHGYLSSRLAWTEVLPLLASEFRVIVPDLPGFGESEKPPPARYAYTFDAFAESLMDLIAGLGLGRVSVCGHSMGGAVALTLAANHPDVVDRLVLVSPPIYAMRMDALSRIAATPVLGALLYKQLYGRALFRSYFRRRVYGFRSQVSMDRTDLLFDLFNAPAAREAAYATMLSLLDTRALVARVPRVNAPTLVGWGRADRAHPVALGRRLARELRSARFEVFECGHSPPEECPDAFAQVAKSFLRENGRGV
jgi:pimeloyl-ACP methyl ester carboxylesterase